MRMILRLFSVLTLVYGCKPSAPEAIEVPKYPAIQRLYEEQVVMLDSHQLVKTVTLDSEKESNTFQMDSSAWIQELSFMEELFPNKPEYIGVFDVEEQEDQVKLILKDGEKGTLKTLTINQSGSTLEKIEGVIHEAKDVYTHHRAIEIIFRNGVIESFNIQGYQKMLFKDTIQFGISARVLN